MFITSTVGCILRTPTVKSILQMPNEPAGARRQTQLPNSTALPDWVPGAVSAYLEHVHEGTSLRQIARERGCHPSTILRQVRRVETERDDPLKDEALDSLKAQTPPPHIHSEESLPEARVMKAAVRQAPVEEEKVEREAKRILRRLCESRSFLVVSPDMDKAAVFREAVPGRKTRIAVVERDVAQAFALSDWIEGKQRGKVGIYTITHAGRAALKRLLLDDRNARIEDRTYAEQSSPYQDQHRTFGTRFVSEPGGGRKVRYNLAESPLTVLARKKGPDGAPYLVSELLAAGERLREDFEIAQMGPRVTQNWDNFLTSSTRGQYNPSEGGGGPEDARRRVSLALEAMGPGLADIAFRCCCFLEGLEAAEKRLGWSARAGKVVLKIALQRLADHYARDKDKRLIGYAAEDPA